MFRPGALETQSVIRTTVRTLLCLFAIIWLAVLQCPIADDQSPSLSNGLLAFFVANLEVCPGDDLGAALEDSVELLRADLQGDPSPIDVAASASKASTRNATISRPDLS